MILRGLGMVGVLWMAALAACAPIRVSGPGGPRPSIAPDEAARTVDLPELGVRLRLGDVIPLVRKGDAGIQGGNPDGHMSVEIVGSSALIFFTCSDGRVQLSCRSEHRSIDEFSGLSGLSRTRRGRFRTVLEGRVPGDAYEGGYAALQSTWRDPATSTIHGWYHAEIFVRGTSDCAAYGSIGYAMSTDGGRSFRKQGIVLTSPHPRDESRCLGQGVQLPKVIDRGDYLYMFFTIDHPSVLAFRGIGIVTCLAFFGPAEA